MIRDYGLGVKLVGTAIDGRRVFRLNGRYVAAPVGFIVTEIDDGVQFVARSDGAYLGSKRVNSRMGLYPAYVAMVKLLQPHGLHCCRLKETTVTFAEAIRQYKTDPSKEAVCAKDGSPV